MINKTHLCLTAFLMVFAAKAFPQYDTFIVKKPGNLFMILLQPSIFRLNYFDPEFFNNPDFKPGIDFCFHYGRNIGRTWVIKTGGDVVFNPGRFKLGKFLDNKYINEAFLRIPLLLTKKFPIDCNDCFMSPSVFIEAGGYGSVSMMQTIYIQDQATGLSSQDEYHSLSYLKAGYTASLGLSFLSNNFGRHVLGVKVISDQWNREWIKNGSTVNFKPYYGSVSFFYNIVNFNW